TGDSVLNNVTVTDSLLPGNVFGPATLQPGETVNFGPFTITPQACGPSTDKFHVTGVDACNKQVSGDSQTCTTQVGTTPCLTVTKTCTVEGVGPTAVIHVTATVNNCGDSPLTVTVTDDHAGALSGPATIAPGASGTYTGSYAPGACGDFTDTVT